MSLASFQDANNHLDQNKVKFANADDARDIAESVDRYVRGRLASVFADTYLLWDIEPTAPQVDTPDTVREVASMLMAAKLYAIKYSLEENVTNTYSSRLKRDADMMLDQIIDGTILLEGIESGTAFNEDDFWPNDTTALSSSQAQPRFSMDDDL